MSRKRGQRRIAAAVVLLFAVGCGGEPVAPAATGTATPQPSPSLPTQAPTPSPEPVSEAWRDAEPERPALLLAVEGADEEGVVFRGWPWRVQAIVLRGAAPTDVHCEGIPSLVAADGAWYVPAAASASVNAPNVRFVAGDAQVEVRVVDAPRAPAARQVEAKHRLVTALALAQNDVAAARAAVDAWLAEAPHSAAAIAARGDVLLAGGDSAGAMAAFADALANVPPGALPPASLHRRLGDVWRDLTAKAAGGEGAVTAPQPAEPASRATAPAASAPEGAAPGTIVAAASLDDAAVLAAPHAQWASEASAGSQYSAPDYAAARAVGAPDVPAVGGSPLAWCPASQNAGTTWLELTFATPVSATGVRVRQNDAPGGITQVEAIADDGSVHLWWRGTDPLVPPAIRAIVWFGVDVPATTYRVARIRLTFDLAAVPGWHQIDAVQLLGAR